MYVGRDSLVGFDQSSIAKERFVGPSKRLTPSSINPD